MCLGKRFGEYELRALAAVLLHPRALRAVLARESADRHDAHAGAQGRAAVRDPSPLRVPARRP